MPWIGSLSGHLVALYLIALTAFAAALAWDGSRWLAFAAVAAALAYPAWRLLERVRRLHQIVARIARSGAVGPGGHEASLPLESHLAAMADTFREQLAAAREEKEKLEAVVGGMVEGVLLLDHEGVIRLSNRCADRLFGPAAGGSPIGQPLIAVSRDPDLHELVREVMRADPGQPRRREIVFEGAARESLQVTATAIGESPATSPLFILVFHDITELKRLEATRRDFVANVSHELRTPLTAIRGYAETLQQGALKDAEVAGRFVEVIARHSERLGRLIDDLLALSDLELGRTEMQLSPTPVEAAVDGALEVLREKAEQRRVELRRDVAAGTPAVLGDADRIEQLLVNLVDNAVKYTPEGGAVTVRARASGPPEGEGAVAAAGRDEGRAWVELSVFDTGIGIPRNELPRLTERFYRVDRARSRALGGTGLGLAIVKHIVQAHGGVLRIDSEFGRGTCVSVYFPAER